MFLNGRKNVAIELAEIVSGGGVACCDENESLITARLAETHARRALPHVLREMKTFLKFKSCAILEKFIAIQAFDLNPIQSPGVPLGCEL